MAKIKVPGAGELSEAVAVVIKEHIGPVNGKIVLQKLNKKHPDWRIPERRVNKFVKRLLAQSKNPAGADDDQTANASYKSSSKSKPRGARLKKFFSRKNIKEQMPEPIPESAPPRAEEPVKEPESEPEPAVEERAAVVEAVEDPYVDDNTGSEKEKCECNACSIM